MVAKLRTTETFITAPFFVLRPAIALISALLLLVVRSTYAVIGEMVQSGGGM
jgi:hypothetical protein